MAKIKICGLSRLQDIAAVNEAKPDYVGFVFAQSRRQINEATAAILKQRLDPVIPSVGVFVNEDINRIAMLCRSGIIDLIQLHGDEDESYIQHLKAQVQSPIIKAVRMKNSTALTQKTLSAGDYLLLDAYHKTQYGGSGETFDWSLIRDPGKEYFLAGGITCENVTQAIRQLQPYGIDVSSSVETDGLKDRKKILEMVRIVRNTD